jgi:flagellar basal-body rod protein FlgF
MQTSSYVSLSGQLALERRMETIAQNIANATTPGYRADGVGFEKLLSRTGAHGTEFVSSGQAYVDLQAGGLSETGNPLDISVKGDGFLAFEGPRGTHYSRDGRLVLSPTGQLTSVTGLPLLDIGGATLSLNPAGGTISISESGSIMQDGSARGIIGLYKLDLSDGFQRVAGSGLLPVKEAELVSNFTSDHLVQGYVEQSNVSPVQEMARLIQVSRMFEAASTLSEKAADAERSALQALGPR